MNNSTDHITVSIQIYCNFKYEVKKKVKQTVINESIYLDNKPKEPQENVLERPLFTQP